MLLPKRLLALLPGLLLIVVLTAASYLLARLPWPVPLGSLVIALFVGLAWRSLAGLAQRAEEGVAFAARDLLKLGIVCLGVRLDFGLLFSVGPVIALGSILVVGLGVWAIERLGRRLSLAPGLRLAIAVGTSICGASAILAVASATKIRNEEAGVAVGIISLVGTLGVVAFTLVAGFLDLSVHHYGLLVGLTLQEVAQVIAAGYVPGTESGDVATVVKLARVALLAPALFVLSSILKPAGVSGHGVSRDAQRATGDAQSATDDAQRATSTRSFSARWRALVARLPVPAFLLGFLAMGVVSSLGWLGAAQADLIEGASLLLTTAAMVGLGLRVNLSLLRRSAGSALLVGVAGFAGLVVLVSVFLAVVKV